MISADSHVCAAAPAAHPDPSAKKLFFFPSPTMETALRPDDFPPIGLPEASTPEMSSEAGKAASVLSARHVIRHCLFLMLLFPFDRWGN